jgi:hypothetical protein
MSLFSIVTGGKQFCPLDPNKYHLIPLFACLVHRKLSNDGTFVVRCSTLLFDWSIFVRLVKKLLFIDHCSSIYSIVRLKFAFFRSVVRANILVVRLV